MSTNESGGRTGSTRRAAGGRRVSRPALVVALLVGAVLAAVSFANGEIVAGIISAAIMLAFAAFLLIGSRFSDTIALLGDDVHEERHVHLHQRAALYSINIVAGVVVVAGIVDMARGGSGSPWVYIAALMAVTYAGCLLVLSRRG
ncbi:hypothetical protein [Actinopolymorpha pittospori]